MAANVVRQKRNIADGVAAHGDVDDPDRHRSDRTDPQLHKASCRGFLPGRSSGGEYIGRDCALTKLQA